MKKKKAISLKPKRKASTAKASALRGVAGSRTAPEQTVPSFESLLNKYNQKTPIGSNKTSPAADEEME